MPRFTIRDLLWLMVVVAVAAGWWHDHWAIRPIDAWWEHHVDKYHSDNPNDYKNLIERERPPR